MSGCHADKDKSLWLEGIVQVDDCTAYASCSEFNSLFKVDLKTGHCTYISLFLEEHINKKRLFIKALYVNEKIYFIPASASAVYVYSPKTNTFKRIEIEENIGDKSYNVNAKFADAFLYEGNIYILPATYPAIVKLDYGKNTLEYIVENMPTDDYLFRPGAEQVGNKLWVPNTKDNLVLEFDMETDEIQLHHVGKNNNGSWSIVSNKNNLWLIPKKHGALVRWNYPSGEVGEYEQYPEGYKESDFCFTKGYKSGAYIYAIPAQANVFLKVDSTGNMERNEFLSLAPKDVVMYMTSLGTYEYFFTGDKANTPSSRKFYRVNRRDNVVENWSFGFKHGRETYARDYITKRANLQGGKFKCKETDLCNFESFLRVLVKNQLEDCVVDAAGGSIGENIYKRIM